MTSIFKTAICTCAVLAVFFATALADASTGDFYQSYSPARVIAHLPLSGGGATQMFLQQEGRTQYLYVQRPSQRGFVVINVTRPERPKVVTRLPLETVTVVGSGLVVTETPDKSVTASRAADMKGAGEDEDNTFPQSVHVLDVSDPAHPLTVRAFTGVTSVLADNSRSLIYVANDKGIWILSHQQLLRRHPCSSSDAISPIPNCN
jgi:hypothetical protein